MKNRSRHIGGKNFPVIILLLLLFCGNAGGARGEPRLSTPSWWLKLRSTAYVFQEEGRNGDTSDRFGAYQQVDGSVSGLAGGRVSLRASGRVYDDFQLDEREKDRARLYTAYAVIDWTTGFSTRLGRQFLHEGAAGLTVDGLWLAYHPHRAWELRGWGGVRAPILVPYRDRVGDFGEDPVVGGRVLYTPCSYFKSSLSYAYLERNDRVSARPLGFETVVRTKFDLRATGRVSYDLLQERWTRAEVIAQWRRKPGCPVFTAQFVDRYPSVDGASYFSRFSHVDRARLARGSVRYEHRTGFGGEVECMGAFVDDRTSTRVGGILLFPLGRVGYSARVGDAGEESRWFGDVRVRPVPWVCLEGGATLSTYALFKDAPETAERDLTSAFGRLRFLPASGVALTLEVQSLENPFYEEDVRFLGGLDLALSGGINRWGLTRNGWFR